MPLVKKEELSSIPKEFKDLIDGRQKEVDKIRIVLKHFYERPELSKKSFDSLDVSPNTIKEYSKWIKWFLLFCSATEIDLDIYLNYKKHLSKRDDIKVTTKNKYLATARVFLKEIARQGFIKDVTLNVKCFKQSKLHKKTGHSKSDIKKLHKKTTNMANNPKNCRLKAIFNLAAMHGLRQVEIARLDVSDVNFFSKTIFIHGKGRDDKEIVHLSDQAIESIRVYMDVCELKEGPLFPSFSNRNKNGRISERSLRRIYDGFKSDTQVTASLHGFRHFYTTEMIKKGVPLTKVQKFTRHRSLEMLQVYNDEVLLKEESEDIHNQCFSEVFE
jgi:site-specific recombinase XerD